MNPDIFQAEHVKGTCDQFFFLLDETCDATFLRRGFRIACISKERLTALTRPRSNKVARAKKLLAKRDSSINRSLPYP